MTVVDDMAAGRDREQIEEEIRQLKEDFDARAAEEHLLFEEFKKEKNLGLPPAGSENGAKNE